MLPWLLLLNLKYIICQWQQFARREFFRKNWEKPRFCPPNCVNMKHVTQKYSDKCSSVNDIQEMMQNSRRATERRLPCKTLPCFENTINLDNSESWGRIGRCDLIHEAGNLEKMITAFYGWGGKAVVEEKNGVGKGPREEVIWLNFWERGYLNSGCPESEVWDRT